MMSPSPSLDTTLKRLAVALDQIEASAERRMLADNLRADREEELNIMQKDRSRLAVELDSAMARAHGLDRAAQEAARRLARAEDAIRAALGEAGVEAAGEATGE